MGETRIVLRGNQATQPQAAVRELVCLGVKRPATRRVNQHQAKTLMSARAFSLIAHGACRQSGSVGFADDPCPILSRTLIIIFVYVIIHARRNRYEKPNERRRQC